MQVHGSYVSASLLQIASAALTNSATSIALNAGMTIEEIRRARLLLLIAKFGGVGSLADRLGMNRAQVSQWKNGSPDSKTGKPREIHSLSARRIEKALGLPEGWMDSQIDKMSDAMRDVDHENDGPVLLSSNAAAQENRAEYELSTDSILFSEAIRERFMQLTPEGKGHARAMLLTGIKEAEELYSERRANAG